MSNEYGILSVFFLSIVLFILSLEFINIRSSFDLNYKKRLLTTKKDVLQCHYSKKRQKMQATIISLE